MEDVTGFARVVEGVTKFSKGNPLLAGAGLGATATAGAVGLYSLSTRKSSSKKRRSKKTSSSKKRKSKSRTRRTPRTAGRGKDRSTRRIRYSKNGQPYVIMKSGKARFIKRSSAKRSHKLKGGRY